MNAQSVPGCRTDTVLRCFTKRGLPRPPQRGARLPPEGDAAGWHARGIGGAQKSGFDSLPDQCRRTQPSGSVINASIAAAPDANAGTVCETPGSTAKPDGPVL